MSTGVTDLLLSNQSLSVLCILPAQPRDVWMGSAVHEQVANFYRWSRSFALNSTAVPTACLHSPSHQLVPCATCERDEKVVRTDMGVHCERQV